MTATVRNTKDLWTAIISTTARFVALRQQSTDELTLAVTIHSRNERLRLDIPLASSSAEKSLLLPYSSEPKWKSTKYGFVPDAKRQIALFGNKLLPDFYESFKTRAGANAALMKQAFIAERDRQYKFTLDIEKLENRYQYLLSDNPACAGRFLREDYKPTPHDDSNIRRCKKRGK